MYLTFSPASENEIPLIQALAQKIWPQAFENILSLAQIEYMMEMMYSEKRTAISL
jgi:diamine N-acetyltransferase